MQVGDGVSEFTPSPSESRALIQGGYDASAQPLLLVRFQDDSIDETPEVCGMWGSCVSVSVFCIYLTLTVPPPPHAQECVHAEGGVKEVHDRKGCEGCEGNRGKGVKGKGWEGGSGGKGDVVL